MEIYKRGYDLFAQFSWIRSALPSLMSTNELIGVLGVVAFLCKLRELRISRKPYLRLLERSAMATLIDTDQIDAFQSDKDKHIPHKLQIRELRVLH